MKLSSLTTLKAGMLMYVCFPHELEHGGSQLLQHHLALAWSETVGAQDLSCRRKIDPKYSPILPSSTHIIRHTIGILRGPCALQVPQLAAQVQSSAVLTVTALSWPWFGLQLYPVHPFCRQGQSPGKATLLAQLSGLSSKYMLAFLNLCQHRTQGTFIRQSSLKAPL